MLERESLQEGHIPRAFMIIATLGLTHAPFQSWFFSSDGRAVGMRPDGRRFESHLNH